MKKIVATILATALCAAMVPMAVSADAVMGTWNKESDTKYSSSNHQEGDAYFDYYELGTADTVTLSAKITVGGQKGFLFGVKDENGDGQIREGADQYYLIDVSGTNVNVERNDKTWGDWSVIAATGKNEGDTCVLKATYKKGTLNVYIDDTKVIEYADPNPFEGTGFGLAAKTDSTFEDVTVDTTSAVNNTSGTILGAGGVDASKADDHANWTLDGTTYTMTRTEDGYGNARFSSYVLGNTDKKVTLSAEVTVFKKQAWGGDNGGDKGFLFAVSDRDGDGKVMETGDFYYLVEISAVQDDGTVFVGVERNAGGWGNFAKQVNVDLKEGDTCTFSATYDPATATITASVNGNVVLEYTDAVQLAGTGYALATKTYGDVFENVKVEVDEDTNGGNTEAGKTETETKPNPTPAPTTGSAVAALAFVGLVSLAGVVVAAKKREQD